MSHERTEAAGVLADLTPRVAQYTQPDVMQPAIM